MSQSIAQQIIWRRQLRKIIEDLKRKWLPDRGLSGSGLLTDLFDEAANHRYLLEPLVSAETPWVGIDKVMQTTQNARKQVHLPGRKHPNVAVCDVRSLAFQDNTFDYVLSHSTLDHFRDKSDIQLAIHEIHRVMKPGGTLIVTLDNPGNPIVFLRNSMPLAVLRMMNIVPYEVGKTIPASHFRSLLERERFTVQHDSFIDHGPRFVTIHLDRWLERNDIARNMWTKFLGAAENLASWPISRYTGYFYAAFAIKQIMVDQDAEIQKRDY